MGMTTGGSGQQKSDINVTPYIDILLVLLIIFMVIQPVDQYDLEAKVPDKSEKQELPKDIKVITDTIVVSIDEKSNLMINADPVTMEQLGPKLFDIYSARPNKNMFIRGAKDLPFGSVVKVIDIAKGSGVGDIGLITDEEVKVASGG